MNKRNSGVVTQLNIFILTEMLYVDATSNKISADNVSGLLKDGREKEKKTRSKRFIDASARINYITSYVKVMGG